MRSRMGKPIYMCKFPVSPLRFFFFVWKENGAGPDFTFRLCVYRIVGKGNHSVDHVQKIKPRVEQICQELGLQYATEENAGRMYINLQGGPATMPPSRDRKSVV